MEFEIKKMNLEEKELVCKWFVEQAGGSLYPNILSENSFMAYKDNLPICSVSAFPAPPAIYITWLIANPKSNLMQRDRAFTVLIKHAEQVGRDAGAFYAVTLATSDVVKKRFARARYSITAPRAVELTKRIID